MKRVSELPALLKVSKQALYKKLSQPKYSTSVKLVDKVKHITDTGFNLLCEEYGVKQPDNAGTTTATPKETEYLEMIARQREEEVNRLTAMLTERDREISNLHRMLENQQILTLNAQSEIKLLSQPLEDKNNQLQQRSSEIRELHQLLEQSQILQKNLQNQITQLVVPDTPDACNESKAGKMFKLKSFWFGSKK